MPDLDGDRTTYEERISGKPIITLSLIAANVIIFIFELIFPSIVDNFSFVPVRALSEPWMFITSMFLHDNTGITHILFNMIALFIFGTYLESRITKTHYLMIYFLSGIVGSIGYMITAPSATTPALGASGAIYGVMGSLAIIMPFATVYVMGIPMPMIVAAFFWGILEFTGVLFPSGNIASGAHVGGLISGIAFGLYLRTLRKRT